MGNCGAIGWFDDEDNCGILYSDEFNIRTDIKRYMDLSVRLHNYNIEQEYSDSIKVPSTISLEALSMCMKIQDNPKVHEVSKFGTSMLLVNERYVLNIKDNRWRNKGKNKWYHYKTISDFLERYLEEKIKNIDESLVGGCDE